MNVICIIIITINDKEISLIGHMYYYINNISNPYICVCHGDLISAYDAASTKSSKLYIFIFLFIK